MAELVSDSRDPKYYDDYFENQTIQRDENEAPQGTNKYGNNLFSNNYEKSVSRKTYNLENVAYGNGPAILGMPLYYTSLADPFNRSHTNVFQNDNNILYIMPGLPRINKKIEYAEKDDEHMKDTFYQYFKQGITSGFSIKNVKDYEDLRFIQFEPDFSNYSEYVNLLLTYVKNMMGIDLNNINTHVWEDEYQRGSDTYGLAYFCNRATTIDESLDNDYVETSMKQNADQNAAEEREFHQLMAMDKTGRIVDKVWTKLKEIMNDIIEDIPVIGHVIAPLGRTANGSQLYYPDIWNDSHYQKNYTVAIKLFSPYGDSESIFKFLYVPFISLLALAMPRQDGIYAYTEPFLIRASCPGYFECDLGAVTSLQYKRGGDDNLWTVAGLPNEIEVNMTIRELYTSLPMTKSKSMLSYNEGLASFIECMAGVRVDQLNFTLRATAMLNTSLSAIGRELSFRELRNHLTTDTQYKIQQKIIRFLR